MLLPWLLIYRVSSRISPLACFPFVPFVPLELVLPSPTQRQVNVKLPHNTTRGGHDTTTHVLHYYYGNPEVRINHDTYT